MPTLETEIGVVIVLAAAAITQLLSLKSSDGDKNVNSLLLASILLQTTITGLWPLSTALRLTESYTRWRITPLRAYWAGAFHLLGALARVTALGHFVTLFLSNAGIFTRLYPHNSWVPGYPRSDANVLAVVYIAAWAVGMRIKQREMDPETEDVVAGVGKGCRPAVSTGGKGWVARGHRVQYWWMFGVANWVRNIQGRDRYEMNWARHWKTEPVAEAGERLGLLEEIDSAEVVGLRAEFWFLVVLYVVFNGCFWTIFLNLV